MSDADPCDACGTSVEDALSRTVRLSVDRSEIDSQRLCPNCFAEWIGRYRAEMQPTSETTTVPNSENTDIIVD